MRDRLAQVTKPDVEDLAHALEVQILPGGSDSDFVPDSLMPLADFDQDGVEEYLLLWSTSQESDAQGGETPTGWSLYLLAWDGSAWKDSLLLSGFEPLTSQVLPALDPNEHLFDVVVYPGSTAAPYPAVFRYRDHKATLLWNGRSDDAQYQAFDNGRLDFSIADGTLTMIETGRADPGFLRFPKNGSRGFDLRTRYRWNGKAFVPFKTDYLQNPDFVLYRFISALHLRDFKTAYAFIEPAKFLKSDKPKLEMFQKVMESQWPEFLDDQIFRARDSGDRSFQLFVGLKVRIYTPTFGGPSGMLITGLSRVERDADAE